MRSFQVSTSRTGLRRTIRVYVYDDLTALHAAYAGRYPDEGWGEVTTTAGFWRPRKTWEDCDPRPWVGSLHLPADATATLIAHEAVHVAMTIYSIDGYREHARASAHLHAYNETVAYMVGDLVSRIAQWYIDHDLKVDVGRWDSYGTAAHPPRIPRDAPL